MTTLPSPNNQLCFVLMPFEKGLKIVYQQAIKPACEKAGFRALRADELIGPYNIHRDIIRQLFLSDVIVADLTGWNPNVFYEMGIAHTLDNKTILIIQEGNRLPFDIGNYRCIFYEPSEVGLELLSHRLTEYLRTVAEWRQHPTNPVQEFKPHEAFVPNSVLRSLQRELQQKDELLRASVPKAEWEKLQSELAAKEKLLSQTAAKSELQALQKELAQKVTENAQLAQELDRLRSPARKSAPVAKPTSTLQLRAQRLEKLSVQAVKTMLEKHDFYCAETDWNKEWCNPKGKGIKHNFELQHDDQVVFDRTTGLIWQQSGSSNSMTYADAEKYIIELNKNRFAGYDDWRLPTLEEAMSLMERDKKKGGLYVDPVFDGTQSWIWTADKESAGRAWFVSFGYGLCHRYDLGHGFYVRAVRS